MAENIQGKVYAPVGVCIYCGRDGGGQGLRTEHVVPYSLGGNAELPEASCRECESITSYLDGYLAKKIFGNFRVHANIQTRRPRERPQSLLARFTLDNGSEIKEEFFAVQDHPLITALPEWPTPGLIRGAAPSDEFTNARARAYYSVPASFRGAASVSNDQSVALVGDLPSNLPTFARAILKIGYCHAVLKYGIGGFRKLMVPDAILGRCPLLPYLVGTLGKAPPPPLAREVLLEIEIGELVLERLRLLVAKVRLFAGSGTGQEGYPVYLAVVGAPRARRDWA